DIIKLRNFEISENDLDKMYAIVKDNSEPLTYRDVFIILNEERNKNKLSNLKKSEEYSAIFTNYGNTDLEELIKKANALNKPLLIYFTGYGCVNSRRMEKNVLTQEVIYQKLKNQFYFVSLYLDDKTLLENSKQFTSQS